LINGAPGAEIEAGCGAVGAVGARGAAGAAGELNSGGNGVGPGAGVCALADEARMASKRAIKNDLK